MLEPEFAGPSGMDAARAATTTSVDLRPTSPGVRLAQVQEELIAWIKTLISAAVYAVLIVTFAFQVARVEGLSMAELDHLQDGSSNSIGALLAHIAVVERGYQCITFEERPPTALEQAAWEPALTLGAEGRRLLRNEPLEHYVHELSEARRITLDGLATRDDVFARR